MYTVQFCVRIVSANPLPLAAAPAISVAMARRRKAGRPRKPSPRTASGRLSRAYQGPARDVGTAELRAKKLSAVNGAGNPALWASAASILLAHGILNRDQHAAAERYHLAYRRSFGLPDYGPSLLGGRTGGGPGLPDEAVERTRQQLDAMVARLTPEQKLQLDNLVISNWIPTWFYAGKGIGRPLASDERDRAALLSGPGRPCRRHERQASGMTRQGGSSRTEAAAIAEALAAGKLTRIKKRHLAGCESAGGNPFVAAHAIATAGDLGAAG
jgi:hypothetical protein